MRKRLANRAFGNPPEGKARERDSELTRGKQPRKVAAGAKGQAGLGVTAPCHRVESGASRPHERKLGGNEESVEQQEHDDGEEPTDHRRKISLAATRTPAAAAAMSHLHLHGPGDPHGHHHGHNHAGHSHGSRVGDASREVDHATPTRRLRTALAVTAVFLVVEVVGGLLANSLALLADAGHMLTDVAALALSLFVAWFSRQPASPQKTYGYLRWEVLAAFLNGATLLLISAWIVWEAIARLRAPEPLQSGLMLIVAVAGLLVNVVAARILHSSGETSLNVRAAYLHVLGDLLGSVGTVAAAVIIRWTGWLAADPIASLIMALLILRGAWGIVRESVDILLEATPSHISLGSVRTQLEAIPGIESVHDVHVWTITSGLIAMSAHAIVREPDRHQHVLEHVHDAMRLFGIDHVTVQLERREMYERERHLHD